MSAEQLENAVEEKGIMLRPMADAPKDGKTRILIVFRDDIYPGLISWRPEMEGWHGVVAVARHTGWFDGIDKDLGWNIAAPVGSGGIPDRWLKGWMPLPDGLE